MKNNFGTFSDTNHGTVPKRNINGAITHLKNRLGKRDSKCNPSILGLSKDEILELVNRQLDHYAKGVGQFTKYNKYTWSKDMRSLVYDFCEFKLLGINNRPITSQRRLLTIITHLRIFDKYLKENKTTLETFTAKQGKDFVDRFRYEQTSRKTKRLSQWTINTRIKGVKLFLNFVRTTRCSTPIDFAALSGAKYIIDVELPSTEIKIHTYSEKEVDKILNNTQMEHRLIYHILYDTNCRINELLDSNLSDFVYNATNDCILWKVAVSKTKSGLRTVIIKGKTKDILLAFLDAQHNVSVSELGQFGIENDRPLFYYLSSGGLMRRMSHRGVLKQFQNYCVKLNISQPHHFKRFRSTGATRDAMNPKYSNELFNAKMGHSVNSAARLHYVDQSSMTNNLMELETAPVISNINSEQLKQLQELLGGLVKPTH
jgi:integrase